jgi:hypothetical protein
MSEEDKMATDWRWCWECPRDAAYEIDHLKKIMQEIIYLCNEWTNDEDVFLTLNAIRELAKEGRKFS